MFWRSRADCRIYSIRHSGLSEEAVGFEPTVAINYDSFQDCSVRPLRNASAQLFKPNAWRLEKALRQAKTLQSGNPAGFLCARRERLASQPLPKFSLLTFCCQQNSRRSLERLGICLYQRSSPCSGLLLLPECESNSAKFGQLERKRHSDTTGVMSLVPRFQTKCRK